MAVLLPAVAGALTTYATKHPIKTLRALSTLSSLIKGSGLGPPTTCLGTFSMSAQQTGRNNALAEMGAQLFNKYAPALLETGLPFLNAPHKILNPASLNKLGDLISANPKDMPASLLTFLKEASMASKSLKEESAKQYPDTAQGLASGFKAFSQTPESADFSSFVNLVKQATSTAVYALALAKAIK